MVTRTGTVARATASAIRAGRFGPQDAAAVALAKHYARLVDDGNATAGPKLLRVLESLGLTPAGRRARAEVNPDAPPVPGWLAELRQRADARRYRRSA